MANSRSDTDVDGRRSVLADAGQVIWREAEAIASVTLDERFLAALDLVLRAPGRVITAGSGTSGFIARRCAHLLSTAGTPTLFVHPGDALHGGLGAVTNGDVVLAVSKGGQTVELNIFAARAKERGASVVALTSAPDSPLAAQADLVIALPATAGADPGGVLAMGSSLVAAAWGDALAWALMKLRRYPWDHVLHSHPAGAVGTRPVPSPNKEESP
ncbi:hypothetical protein GCM10012275_56080 [Longimycelium tulufanense]|uniref:SIS domain-containing protein n=1 Tax=Longimycelium tulufanense TaxID=907463 RepID=A0A8J3FZ94_9PSEU|nr:SIS domain-containing protein [Longimycelium tulufanense]GGM78224.1 hypothetical protein GCM10012275_56080 [Longimycelium tulufanense]